jgi:uncharacterized protein (DUF58 family)
MPVIFLTIGFLLLIWGTGKLYQRLWSKNLEVDVRFQAEPAMEGGTATLTEIISNRKRFPLPLLHVKFETSRYLDFGLQDNVSVSDRTYKNDLFGVMSYQQIRRTLSFACKKRGYYTIDRVELVGSFLFFHNFQHQRLPVQTGIYVYPKRLQIPELDVFMKQLIWSQNSRTRLYEDPFSFAGIREYAPGDPQKAINWNASAKTGQLMVNRRDYTAGQPVVVLVNLEPSITWHTDTLLEESIRLAVTAADRLMGAGIPVSVWTTHDTTGLTAPEHSVSAFAALNKRMALIDLEKNPMDYATWLQQIVVPRLKDSYGCLVISYEEREYMRRATERLSARQGELWCIIPRFEDGVTAAYQGPVHVMERVVNRHA